jgi:hypothetical protein
MPGSDGSTVGFDLRCEARPGKWVRADQPPEGVLAEERRRGTLQSGILYSGKLYHRLNVRNLSDKLIAARNRLELKADEYKGGRTAFKMQVGDPFQELSKNIEGVIRQLRILQRLESETRESKVQPLNLNLKRAKKTSRKLQKEGKQDR